MTEVRDGFEGLRQAGPDTAYAVNQQTWVGETRPIPIVPVATVEDSIGSLVALCHGRAVAAGWYKDPKTGLPIERNVGEQIALMHSELSEMLEAVRKNLPSDHLPGFSGEEEEAADELIRVFDYSGARSLRLGAAVVAKLEYNRTRADHKLENRAAAGGKSF